jgi:hypothetical protein
VLDELCVRSAKNARGQVTETAHHFAFAMWPSFAR